MYSNLVYIYIRDTFSYTCRICSHTVYIHIHSYTFIYTMYMYMIRKVPVYDKKGHCSPRARTANTPPKKGVGGVCYQYWWGLLSKPYYGVSWCIMAYPTENAYSSRIRFVSYVSRYMARIRISFTYHERILNVSCTYPARILQIRQRVDSNRYKIPPKGA